MSLTLQPLTASVTIIKSGTSYFNSATTNLGATEFRLIEGMVALAGTRPATAQLIIEDNSNKLFSTFTAGSTVFCAIGKKASTFLTVFGGMIERSNIKQEVKNISMLRLNITDWAQNLMNKTVIHYERHQKRDTAGALNTADAANVLVTDIIVDLMNSSSVITYQNGVNSGISTSLSTVGGRITPSNISIPDVSFIYKPLHDCVKELFEYIRYIWGVDQDGVMFGRPDESAPDSGVTLDGSTIMNIDVEEDITDTKNRIFVIGSDQVKIGVSSSTATGAPLNTSSQYLSQKFIPTADDIRFIQFNIDKVGAPANLTIGLYQDSSNAPTGQIIKVSDINKNEVSSTAAAWRQVEINEKITTSTAYWIVLFRSADTSNYYRWYTDAGNTGTTATGSDGITWSVNAASSVFAHQIWFGNPLVYIAEDIPSTSTYGVRELPWRQAEISNFEQGIMFGKGLLGSLGRKKQLIQLTSFVPNTVIVPGQRITVANSNIVTTSFIMTDVNYELRGYESYMVEIKGMRFV